MVFEICIEVFNLPKANSHFCKNLRSPEATGNNNNNNCNNNNWVKCLKNSGLTKTWELLKTPELCMVYLVSAIIVIIVAAHDHTYKKARWQFSQSSQFHDIVFVILNFYSAREGGREGGRERDRMPLCCCLERNPAAAIGFNKCPFLRNLMCLFCGVEFCFKTSIQ